MTIQKTIESVVEDGLCAQCGWCVLNCPSGAISQRETPVGHLLPVVEGDKCTCCGICYRNCSGWHVEDGVLDTESDLFEGPILAAFIGHATDTEIRSKAQSGGIISAILCHQIESGNITHALVTEMPTDGSLRPRARLAETREQVLKARGSQYCPVLWESSLSSHLRRADKVSIVGTSCQMQTVCNGQKHGMRSDQIALKIGLFCDQILSYCAIDHLLEAAHVERNDVSSLRYKDRCHGDFPGDLRIDRRESDPLYLSNSIRLGIKAAYTPPRCRLCFDKINVLSDIAVGDTWGITSSKDGCSAILARTKRGLAALIAAESAGAIDIQPVLPQDIIRGQGVDKRRRTWAVCTKAWEGMGHMAPDLNFAPDRLPVADNGNLIKQKVAELRRAGRLASQPTRVLALKEARRQLKSQLIMYWLSGKGPRRQVSKWLRKAMKLIQF